MLDKISDEQQNILASLFDAHVIVLAVAGSGKTTTALHIAQKFAQKQVLLLTYNARLKFETRKKQTELALHNLTVHSFHAFALKFYSHDGFIDSGIEKIVTQDLKPKLPISFDIIIIDEAQDINPLYYQFISKIILNNTNKVRLCLLGDNRQTIYRFKDADERYLTLAPKIYQLPTKEWKYCQLKHSFRVPQTIVGFINQCCYQKQIINSMVVSKFKPKYLIANTFDSYQLLQELKPIFQTYAPGEIFILTAYFSGKDSSPFRKFANILSDWNIDCHVSADQDEELDEKVINNKVVFTSFHQVKGLERKVVIIFGFDQSFFYYGYGQHYHQLQVPNEIYVAMTRAQERLVLIHHYEKPFLSFLQPELISLYCETNHKFNYFYDQLQSQTINKEAENTNLAVTQLTKFLPQSLLSDFNKKIKKKKLTTLARKMQIVTLIQQQNNNYEQVADLSGIAIPAFYQYYSAKIKNWTNVSIFNHLFYLINNRDIFFYRPELAFLLRYQAFINQLAQPNQTFNISDLLKLANVWNAYMSSLNYKLNQIDEHNYSWIAHEQLFLLSKRIANHVNAAATFEYEIKSKEFYQQHGKYLIGFIDCIDYNNHQIWEFKCVKQVKPEHFLQLAIYGYLFLSNNQEPLAIQSHKKITQANLKPWKFYLFNILSNEVWEITFDLVVLKTIIEQLFANRFAKKTAVSDDLFINKNIGFQQKNK